MSVLPKTKFHAKSRSLKISRKVCTLPAELRMQDTQALSPTFRLFWIPPEKSLLKTSHKTKKILAKFSYTVISWNRKNFNSKKNTHTPLPPPGIQLPPPPPLPLAQCFHKVALHLCTMLQSSICLVRPWLTYHPSSSYLISGAEEITHNFVTAAKHKVAYRSCQIMHQTLIKLFFFCFFLAGILNWNLKLLTLF